MKGFGGYHPSIQFLYYGLILLFSMITRHPIVVGLSLIGTFFFYMTLEGVKKGITELVFFVELGILISVMNPLFVHNGETVLFFLNSRAITLEAILYGGMSALMILGVLMWCRCFGKLLTTDKLLYLFGKIIPKAGLILCMAFRFIPLFKLQIGRIQASQKVMGLYAKGGLPVKIRGGMRTFDSLLTWSLENSIDTADAMKARGYGLPGRKTFSIFRFQQRDGLMLALISGLTVILLILTLKGSFNFYFYPTVAPFVWGPAQIAGIILFALFFCLPGLVECKEHIVWNYLKSKI